MLPTLAVQLGTLLSVAVGFGIGWVWRGSGRGFARSAGNAAEDDHRPGVAPITRIPTASQLDVMGRQWPGARW